MDDAATILGIDVGAVSVALCEMSRSGALLHRSYRAHRGDVRGTLTPDVHLVTGNTEKIAPGQRIVAVDENV